MAGPFSEDLRSRIAAALDSGMSCRAAAGRFGIAVSTAVKLRRRMHGTGSYAARPMGGHRPRKLEDHREFIEGLMRERPHLTVRGLRDILAECGVHVVADTAWSFLRREGLSYKKNSVRRRTGAR